MRTTTNCAPVWRDRGAEQVEQGDGKTDTWSVAVDSSTQQHASPAVRTVPAIVLCFAALALTAWCFDIALILGGAV